MTENWRERFDSMSDEELRRVANSEALSAGELEYVNGLREAGLARLYAIEAAAAAVVSALRDEAGVWGGRPVGSELDEAVNTLASALGGKNVYSES